MQDIELINVLKGINIFANLTDQQIGKMIDASKLKDFKQGDVIIKTGDQSTSIYLVISGELEVQNSIQQLATIKANEIVGEMGVLTDEERSTDVIAISNTSALELTKDSLNQLILEDSLLGLKIYKNIIKILSKHMKRNNMLLEFSCIME